MPPRQPIPEVFLATIFISYAREDLGLALALKQKVEASGHKAWIDLEGLPAASFWRQEVAGAIEQADIFLFGLTPDSAASPECQKELDYALQLRKRIIPVVLRGVEPEQVDARLRDIDWVFLRPGDDEPAGLLRLKNAITTDLDHLHRHTRFLLRALEWERARRDRSLLLRGGNLKEAERWLEQSPGKEPAPIPLQGELIQASRQGENRRRVWQTAVAALLVAISVVAAYVAHQKNQTARADLSRRLARDSTAAESLDRMFLLAVAAHEVAPTGAFPGWMPRKCLRSAGWRDKEPACSTLLSTTTARSWPPPVEMAGSECGAGIRRRRCSRCPDRAVSFRWLSRPGPATSHRVVRTRPFTFGTRDCCSPWPGSLSAEGARSSRSSSVPMADGLSPGGSMVAWRAWISPSLTESRRFPSTRGATWAGSPLPAISSSGAAREAVSDFGTLRVTANRSPGTYLAST